MFTPFTVPGKKHFNTGQPNEDGVLVKEGFGLLADGSSGSNFLLPETLLLGASKVLSKDDSPEAFLEKLVAQDRSPLQTLRGFHRIEDPVAFAATLGIVNPGRWLHLWGDGWIMVQSEEHTLLREVEWQYGPFYPGYYGLLENGDEQFASPKDGIPTPCKTTDHVVTPDGEVITDEPTLHNLETGKGGFGFQVADEIQRMAIFTDGFESIEEVRAVLGGHNPFISSMPEDDATAVIWRNDEQ